MPLLSGKTVRLRYVRPSDAAFIVRARTDERRNKYLSPVSPDVSKQVEWITSYMEREDEGAEHYFLVQTHDDIDIGTIRLYDFRPDSFGWGSWLIVPGSPAYAGTEALILALGFGFALGFEKTHFQVSKGNDRLIAFHRRMGVTEISEDAIEHNFEYSRDACERMRIHYQHLLL